jgi:hypothetical protein
MANVDDIYADTTHPASALTHISLDTFSKTRVGNVSLAGATFCFTPESTNAACTEANNAGAEATDLRDDFRRTFQTSACLINKSNLATINQHTFSFNAEPSHGDNYVALENQR